MKRKISIKEVAAKTSVAAYAWIMSNQFKAAIIPWEQDHPTVGIIRSYKVAVGIGKFVSIEPHQKRYEVGLGSVLSDMR